MCDAMHCAMNAMNTQHRPSSPCCMTRFLTEEARLAAASMVCVPYKYQICTLRTLSIRVMRVELTCCSENCRLPLRRLARTGLRHRVSHLATLSAGVDLE